MHIGYKYQIVSYYVYEGLRIISVIATVVLVVVYCKRLYRLQEVEYPQVWLLLWQTLLLMGFSLFVLYLSVGIVHFFVYNYAVILTNSTSITVAPFIIPVGYLVCFYGMRNSYVMQNWCCRFSRSYVISKSRMQSCFACNLVLHCVTHPTSTPQSVPSSTFVAVQYTGACFHSQWRTHWWIKCRRAWTICCQGNPIWKYYNEIVISSS